MASGGDGRDTFHSTPFCIFLIFDIFFLTFNCPEEQGYLKAHNPRSKTKPKPKPKPKPVWRLPYNLKQASSTVACFRRSPGKRASSVAAQLQPLGRTAAWLSSVARQPTGLTARCGEEKTARTKRGVALC